MDSVSCGRCVSITFIYKERLLSDTMDLKNGAIGNARPDWLDDNELTLATLVGKMHHIVEERISFKSI